MVVPCYVHVHETVWLEEIEQGVIHVSCICHPVLGVVPPFNYCPSPMGLSGSKSTSLCRFRVSVLQFRFSLRYPSLHFAYIPNTCWMNEIINNKYLTLLVLYVCPPCVRAWCLSLLVLSYYACRRLTSDFVKKYPLFWIMWKTWVLILCKSITVRHMSWITTKK